MDKHKRVVALILGLILFGAGSLRLDGQPNALPGMQIDKAAVAGSAINLVQMVHTEPAVLAFVLICLLVLCSIAPGLLVVRSLRWSPLEKLCGAVGASLIATFLASFALFCLNAGNMAYLAVSAAFALIGILNWRQMRQLLRHRSCRRTIVGFACLCGWGFLHLALARHFDGGGWSRDWHEHYDRTLYFLHQLPNEFLFADLYLLPARPPMMNLIAAYFCRQVGGINFEAFSLIFLFLNAMVVLPCCLLLTHFGKRSARCMPVLTILFMLNPSIVQNITYTWTKSLAAGFVVLAVCFYLRWLTSARPSRLVAAAIALAAGVLVHYSAIPFAIALSVHLVATIFRRPSLIPQAFVAGFATAILLSTWFGWSIHIYGLHDTLSTNTAVSWTQGESLADRAAKALYNGFSSIVPHPLHPVSGAWFSPIASWADLRDYYFMMSQRTLTTMIGITGGVVLLLVLVQYFVYSRSRQRMFWGMLILISFALGTAVNPLRDPFGDAHVMLQSLSIMGVTLLASRLLELPSLLFWVVMAGLMVDYCLGILLPFERRTYVFPSTGDPINGLTVMQDRSIGIGAEGYAMKVFRGWTFWGDHFTGIPVVLEMISAGLAVWMLVCLIRMRQKQSGRRSVLDNSAD